MDVDRLIQCVRKHVYLYDIAHREYKNIALKTLVWETIAVELNQTSDAVRHKWKTVKDGYIKYKKQLRKASSTGKKVIDYVWSPQLNFLDFYHATRSSNSNVISQAALKSIPNVEPHPSSSAQKRISSIPTMPSFTNENVPFAEPELNQAPTPSKRRKKINGKLNSNRENKIRNHDAIDYLFLSYAQTFKKFSLRKQALLKMELAKLFSNAELEELGNSFAYLQPDVGTDYVESPAYSSVSSTESIFEQQKSVEENDNGQSIKQENSENPLPDDFQGHIVP